MRVQFWLHSSSKSPDPEASSGQSEPGSPGAFTPHPIEPLYWCRGKYRRVHAARRLSKNFPKIIQPADLSPANWRISGNRAFGSRSTLIRMKRSSDPVRSSQSLSAWSSSSSIQRQSPARASVFSVSQRAGVIARTICGSIRPWNARSAPRIVPRAGRDPERLEPLNSEHQEVRCAFRPAVRACQEALRRCRGRASSGERQFKPTHRRWFRPAVATADHEHPTAKTAPSKRADRAPFLGDDHDPAATVASEGLQAHRITRLVHH